MPSSIAPTWMSTSGWAVLNRSIPWGEARIRSELPVAGIPQTRHDVADLVDALIDRPNMDVDIGVGRAQPLDPLGRSQNQIGTAGRRHPPDPARCSRSR